MLILYVEAPFAVCRTFTAGWYRPTATFLTPSAAYGLLLNLAGIETRLREEDERHPGSVPATLTLTGLPQVRLALGAAAVRHVHGLLVEVPESERYPRVATVYQQLHNYPVGDAKPKGAVEKPSVLGMRRAKGNKYNIAPVRREFLVGLRAVIVVDGNADLEANVLQGLGDGLQADRYGLPFLGDNAFLPDRIDPLDTLPPIHWYERVDADAATLRPRTTRLTVWIDRADMSRTTSALFAPTLKATTEPPSNA
ncbi:MAG TPA: type I-MYXAN CRISPR-associated protein Cas5/Cmx5/DevS [Gemmataceae bacterium]|nr:type I-MYXAN CRISPR-associated protein Cas5/Cmx5/DevS [Gemmataceae bacterium]